MDVLRRNCDLCVIKKVSRKKQLPCSQHLSSPLLCRVLKTQTWSSIIPYSPRTVSGCFTLPSSL